MKGQLSNTRRELFERIERKNREAKEWEQMFPQGGASALGPGALTMALQFEAVDDIAQFQIEYAFWMQEKRVELQRKELARRLSSLDTEGIVSGRPYDDYMERFQYMLDTISLMGELGQLNEALELTNRVFPLAEIAASNPTNQKLLAFEWLLKSDALWTTGNVFDQEDLFLQSLECMEHAGEAAKSVSELSAFIRQRLAERHLSLFDSEHDPDSNLKSAKGLLEPLATAGMLDTEGWSAYFRVLVGLSEYKKAHDAAESMIEAARAEETTISDVTIQEIVAVEYLSKYSSPKKFLTDFGPFAGPIYAECKGLYLSEAWLEIYDEPIPQLRTLQSLGSAFLIENVVVYEENDPLTDQVDIMLHESIHKGVSSGQAYKSEKEWLRAYRDVPTAALLTYMGQIEKSRKSGTALADSLCFFVDCGRKAFNNEPQKCDHYIERMLEYFEKHGQETNAAYQCAGIHAGMLVELMRPFGSDEIQSYIFHLEVTDHKTALEKGKRKIDLII